MIGILLLGHGSRQKNAEREFNLVSNVISTLIPYPVCQAVLGNGEPTIETAVENLINPQIKKIIIVPVFLFEGTHVQIDIPDKLNNLRLKYPKIEFEMTDCFGADGRIIDIITSRIKQSIGDGFAPESLPQTPSDIEQESFNRIEKALNLIGHPDSHPLIVKKIVHTVGDLAIASEVYAPNEAVGAGVKAIRDGKNIVTDVEMVKAGIRGKKLSSFGSDIFCLIKENRIAEDASKQGTTRAALAIKTAADMAEGGIIAIGNAPTALFEVCRLLKAKTIKPALVVGAPVGFVGCAESKEVLMRSGVPCIVVKGARGGSPVAATIVNALIDLADKTQG